MRIPIATYRIQFHPGFSFQKAGEILPYLADLGISDLYASPIFKSRSGSVHGYDVTDPTRIDVELGGEEEFNRLAELVQKAGMGWIQDIVPNHMAYSGDNAMLMDVLENGDASPYRGFFDVQWNHPFETIRGKLLAPFLGKFYGECLEEGEISLRYDPDGLSVNYYNIRLPLKIESYAYFFTHNLDSLKESLGSDHSDVIKLFGVLYSLKNLPSGPESLERYKQIRFVKKMLWDLYCQNPEIAVFVDRNIQIFNGERGNPESFGPLDALLSEQHFRLLFWKVATEEVNYRRFFNVNDLISLRMEDEGVFLHTHALILSLLEQGKFTGLRVDHVDGLYDPVEYLQRLRRMAGGVYLVVEKILSAKESLPPGWPVQGTTGYDFAAQMNALFCDRTNQRKFTRIYRRFTNMLVNYADLVAAKKRLITGKHMAGDIDRLAHLMKNISGKDRHGMDITLYGLRRALVELMAFFPVYRTYVSRETYSSDDRAVVKEAIGKAKTSNPDLLHELSFIETFLLLNFPPYLTDEQKEHCLHFILRFQQVTGPLMAKGFEDTTFYIYNRLLSLNEVGSDPNRFGITIREFHEFNKTRVKQWPHSMNATSTHDTKRGEDIRARLNVLSEIPEEWNSCVRTWSKINEPLKRKVNEREVPDKNDEYFLYQTLIGAYPFHEAESSAFLIRLKEYMIKAVREAKIHTAWLKPDTEYEEAYLAFLSDLWKHEQFRDAFLAFQKKIAFYGILNSLSQTLIKMTTPGVPDFYQGTELWDLNFVDPDNRRPVDFELREKFLKQIMEKEKGSLPLLVAEMLFTPGSGMLKLYTMYRTLRFRSEKRQVFDEGDYLPLVVEGRHQNRAVAYARRNKDSWAITITPRRITQLVSENEYPLGEEVWGDTRLIIPRQAPHLWKNIFSEEVSECAADGALPLANILRSFPVALLFGGAPQNIQKATAFQMNPSSQGGL